MVVSRQVWADNAKFIGIALMVLGHEWLVNTRITDYIYSFHMPLFFILSGYFASGKNEAFMPYLKKNIQSLIIPYVVFNILTLPLEWNYMQNAYDMLGISNSIDFIMRPILGIFTVTTSSYSFSKNPTWFLIALFWVKMMFYVCKRYGCRLSILFLSVLFSLGLYAVFSSIHYGVWPLRLNSACLAFQFYVLGYIISHYTRIIDRITQIPFYVSFITTFALAVMVWFVGKDNGRVLLSDGGYGNNILLMIVTSLMGSLAVLLLATKIYKNKYLLTIGGGVRLSF